MSNSPEPNLEDLPGELAMTRAGESSRRALGQVDAPRETFCGFDSVEAVRDKLTRLQADLPRDINLAYADEFVAAAAPLEHYAPPESPPLSARLKAQRPPPAPSSRPP